MNGIKELVSRPSITTSKLFLTLWTVLGTRKFRAVRPVRSAQESERQRCVQTCRNGDSPELTLSTSAVDEQLFIIPFAKSAVTSLHTPDNTNHAFLQLDDGLLVYRGADQPDMSVINPESDVWQSIKVC